MNPIRDDDPAYTSDKIREVEARAEDSTRRIAAAIAGALDGFVEALDRYDIANEAKEASHQAGEITRSAALEGRAIGQTPEMQKVGEGIRHASHATGETVSHATDAVKTRAHELRESATDAAHAARDRFQHAKDEVKVRAQAVAESGRRARSAPGIITHEIAEAFRTWRRALMTSLAMMGVIALFATTALVVLTVALVVGLNELVGDPLGTFLVAILYVIVAAIAYGVSRGAKARAALEREERMANAREEVRHVVRPVRDAFSRGKTGT